LNPHKRYEEEKRATYLYVTENNKKVLLEYGFDIETPYVEGKEAIVVSEVQEGGIFDRAGIKKGSHLLDCTTVWIFFALATAHKSPVTFLVLTPEKEVRRITISRLDDGSAEVTSVDGAKAETLKRRR
jgi:hypothetical protein